MKYSNTFCLLVLCAAAASFTGCAMYEAALNTIEKVGMVVDGSAFAEKKTAVYKTETEDDSGAEITALLEKKTGRQSVVIVLDTFPSMKIRGTMPNEQGAFNLVSLDYIGGNVHGWNQFRLDLSGTGILMLDENTASLTVSPDIEKVQISSGRIRRYDTRITGGEALTSLRNRHERILAMTEWMNGREENRPADLDEFEEYWKPILFPEMVSKKNRPASWEKEVDIFVRAEDIGWNTGYTERAFPELLWGVRNSGTMLRDWEEAADWLYIEYEWSHILQQLAGGIIVPRKK